MPKTLGELEQSILFALLELEEDQAYGVAVRDTIQARTGRSLSTGAIYTGLDRLREQGLIDSWIGEPTPERGGRRKRLYRLQPAGLEALDRSVRVFRAISDGLLGRLSERLDDARGSAS